MQTPLFFMLSLPDVCPVIPDFICPAIATLLSPVAEFPTVTAMASRLLGVPVPLTVMVASGAISGAGALRTTCSLTQCFKQIQTEIIACIGAVRETMQSTYSTQTHPVPDV